MVVYQRKVHENKEIVFDWDTRWRFAKDIANGIDFFHNMGVIHRDLKSDNIDDESNFDWYQLSVGLGNVESQYLLDTRIIGAIVLTRIILK